MCFIKLFLYQACFCPIYTLRNHNVYFLRACLCITLGSTFKHSSNMTSSLWEKILHIIVKSPPTFEVESFSQKGHGKYVSLYSSGITWTLVLQEHHNTYFYDFRVLTLMSSTWKCRCVHCEDTHTNTHTLWGFSPHFIGVKLIHMQKVILLVLFSSCDATTDHRLMIHMGLLRFLLTTAAWVFHCLIVQIMATTEVCVMVHATEIKLKNGCQHTRINKIAVLHM